MRALIMNLSVEPAFNLFEVSAMIALPQSKQMVKRVLKVLAQTPKGAIKIARQRYPLSRSHQVLSQAVWDQLAAEMM